MCLYIYNSTLVSQTPICRSDWLVPISNLLSNLPRYLKSLDISEFFVGPIEFEITRCDCFTRDCYIFVMILTYIVPVSVIVLSSERKTASCDWHSHF
jgi:hypothetical protein